MSLIVSNHAAIINLCAVYRDLAWDAATVRDNLEKRVISANHAKAKKYREEFLYEKTCTQSDGYVLVYNFDCLEDKEIFEKKAIELGLVRSSHIASSFCIWLQSIVIEAKRGEEMVYLEGVKHVDDPSSILRLSDLELDYLNGVEIVSAVAKSCQISRSYIEYTNRSMFWMIVTTALSLIKTRGSHVNYFTPYKYEFSESPFTSMKVGRQCLPGISSVVPRVEHEKAIELDDTPDYYKMFSVEL